MVAEEVINVIPQEFIAELSQLNFFIQAIGGILIFYIIFNLVNVWLNRRKKNHLRGINYNTAEIKKLLKEQNKLLGSKKK